MLHFRKKYPKILSSEAIRGNEADSFKSSLYKNCVFITVACAFSSLRQLWFLLAYNRKSESRSFILSHWRYFDKNFTEMLLEQSCMLHINFI